MEEEEKKAEQINESVWGMDEYEAFFHCHRGTKNYAVLSDSSA